MSRYLTFVFCSIGVFLFLTPLTAHAQTPEPGPTPDPVKESAIVIEGQITNATPGGSVPANLPMMLHIYDNKGMGDMVHGAADGQGHFRFENVTTAPGRTFAVMVTYNDVTYFSGMIEPQAGRNRLNVPVSIYETTTNPESIQVAQQHLLLDFQPAAVHVTQLFILSNLGDRTVVDGENHSVRFHLPAGATDVTFERDEGGERFILLDDGFADTAPVAPGRNSQAIIVNYTLAQTDEDAIELEFPVDYPTAQTAVLLPEVGPTLEGSEWAAGEELLIRDSVHQVYSYRPGALTPGESLRLVISGQLQLTEASSTGGRSSPPASAEVPARSSRLPIFMAGVALSLTLIGSGTVWLWHDRRREPGPGSVPASTAHDSASETLESVLEAIAALDEEYETGSIDEAEYHERRASLRDEAVALMMVQK